MIKLYRLTTVKLHQKSIYKDKEKRHRVFDAEVNDNNNFFFDLKNEKKVNNEIDVLFKKTVSKILKFK